MNTIDCICPECMEKIPAKRVIGQPWLSKGLLKCSKKQLSLYKTALSSKSEIDQERYKQYHNVLKKGKRARRETYYVNRCYELRSNTKKLWSMINNITGKTKDKTCVISEISVDKIAHKNATDIVNILGEQFANIGKTYAQKIKSNTEIDVYLKKIEWNNKSIYLYPTNRTEIAKIIDSLPNKNSCGWEGISNKTLKNLKTSLIEPLCILFNESLESGQFPDIMKLANVVPLYKSGKKYIPTNYRPISLLITMSEVLEKIMYSRTYTFLNETGQLYCGQYGFRKNHSCEHAVQELVDNALKGMERKEYTIAIYLDLSKAFDTLEHDVLLKKMELYGIQGTTLKWYKNYLMNRKISVKCVSGTDKILSFSDEFPVTFGVPQGSCLGPLLFLIFCNDLPLNLSSCNSILFADDTTLYKSHKNLRFLSWSVQEELKQLSKWFKSNKLTLNPQKCVSMLFGGNSNDINLKLELDGVQLKQVQYTKFLGVWIDEKLCWCTNFDKTIVKLKQNVNLLKISRKFLNVLAKRLIYFVHIHSHITYC